jgi:hypothetical protein
MVEQPMSRDFQLSVSLPLDSDGFLRRECPTCEREFKWLSAEEDAEDVAVIPDGGYFCPYCSIQAPSDAWWTPAQLQLVNGVLSSEVVEPELRKFERELGRTARRSGGHFDVNVRREKPQVPPPLVEVDDMRRIDFDCHPAEPVKVLEAWAKQVHCLICGKPTEA